MSLVMNSSTGGPVGGGMVMMNNGSPAVLGGMGNGDPVKQMLNQYIYDYLLKNGHYDAARNLHADSKFEFSSIPKSSPGRRKDGDMNGDAGDGMDMDAKDDAPDDLPRPQGWNGTQGNGFLMDWFSIFMDLFQAHRSPAAKGMNGQMKPGNPASQYLAHEQNNQRLREQMQNQNLNRANINNAIAQQMRMNGKVPQGQLTPQQMQAMQQKQRAQIAMQQQIARGEQPDAEMNGVRSGSPVDGDVTGSPSKRPRIDGSQQNFQPGMMQNGRPAGVPGAPNGGMMIQAPFNPGMNQQFQRNGGMPPKAMQAGMQNGMMNMTNAGSPMMAGINQFSGDNIQMEMYNRQNMQGAQPMQGNGGGHTGNHALQDYQMQLMLLEQQNKKRLMMARQEQHENNPNATGIPGVGMQPGLSPSGSRTGTSPNPGEMKRTPGMGGGMPGSPSGAEGMAGRSPAAMGFMGGMQGTDFNSSMFMKDQPMMNPGGPQGMRPPTSNDIMRQQAGRPNFQGGQPMQQQGSQAGQQMSTPGQRTDMPPPSAPSTGTQQRNNGNSPGNAPPTPSQTSKPAPKNKKAAAKDDNKRRPNKKGSTANASASDENPPATPQPSTPITPNNPGAINIVNKGQPGMQQANQHQQNQPMMNPAMGQPDFGQLNFDAGTGPSGEQFNLDFSTLENADVLENFDFDSFLNTSADEGFNFGADVELGGDFGMGQDN